MKIKNFIFSVMLGGASLSVTSCGGGGDLLNSLIQTSATVLGGTDTASTKYALVNVGAQVLSGLLTNNQGSLNGQEKQFSGAYTAQLLKYDTKSKGYAEAGKAVSTTATSVLYVQDKSLSISVPAINASGANMTKVGLTNLVATNGIYNLSESSTVTEGKLTYNNQTYDLANAYVELTYDGTALKYSASIYFNYDEASKQYIYAMNVTFNK